LAVALDTERGKALITKGSQMDMVWAYHAANLHVLTDEEEQAIYEKLQYELSKHVMLLPL
jgi:hypothetical protein